MAPPKGWVRRGPGIARLPGFTESLRLLLVEEKYTIHDVGLMFGVTRERIRQIADTLGIERPDKWGGLRCVRVWDDDHHRFVPLHKGVLNQLEALNARESKRKAREEKYARRWAEAVAELQYLAHYLDRSPTLAELSRALGLPRNPAYIVHYLLGPTPGGNGRSSLASLYVDAGLTPRGQGATGHLGKAHRTLGNTCRRGHPRTPENIYVRPNRPRAIECRICWRLRHQSKKAAARELAP